MAEKVDEDIRCVINRIEEKLHLLEEYAAWTIRAEQRFKIGQRVEFSRKADEAGVSRGKKKGAKKGRVKSIVGAFFINVLLDGYSRPSSYHHSFFNPVSGPKLF